MCRSQIGDNTKEEYDLPYLRILRVLCAEVGDKAGEAEVMARLLPLDLDFEAYQYRYSHTPEEARKELRLRIYIKARQGWSAGSYRAVEFCFRLLLSEGAGLRLIALLDAHMPYGLLADYADDLAAPRQKTCINDAAPDFKSGAAY